MGNSELSVYRNSFFSELDRNVSAAEQFATPPYNDPKWVTMMQTVSLVSPRKLEQFPNHAQLNQLHT
jgi:hypothetical protein